MVSSMPAPVSITVYNRREHLRECVDSLLRNSISSETDLYIHSDAARPGDEESIEKVRSYAQSISGFKNLTLNFQENNDSRKNSREATQIPLGAHTSVIVMEDDNLVSPHFLDFMNDSLQRYESDDRILAVSGYSPPVRPWRFTKRQVYLSRFFSAWTVGFWRRKPVAQFLDVSKPYEDMVSSGLLEVVRGFHPKLPDALSRIDHGLHRAGDQQLTYFMIKHGLLQLKPARSLVMNTGHDGSGVHSPRSSRFSQPPYAGQVDASDIEWIPMDEIDKAQYRYFYRRLTKSNFRKYFRAGRFN